MTIRELRKELLSATEAVDARLILRLATGLDDIHQITESCREVTDEEEKKAMELLRRRLSGEPMAYITGEKEFYGHAFSVSPAVLIPRPDTETLVDTVIKLSDLFSKPRILDLCTGSGAVAASVAAALGTAVQMSDISEAALSVAKGNYRRITGMDAEARCGDLLAPWDGTVFSIIASNPPYLTDKWYEDTDKDIKAEPENAFIGGGEDGLELIRRIIRSAPEHLEEGGFLALECDYRQMGICGNLLEKGGFTDIHTVRDLADKERVIYGRRLPE